MRNVLNNHPATDKNPTYFSFITLKYGATLYPGLFLFHRDSLYTSPNIEGYEENKYARMNILSLFYSSYKPEDPAIPRLQKIHDLNVDYIQTRSYGSTEAVEALQRNIQLDQRFPHFGSLIALKDYSFGSENPNNFQYIRNSRGNLEAVHYVPLNPAPTPEQDPTYTPPLILIKNPIVSNPGTLTNRSLIALQGAHRYIQYAPGTNFIYIYLDSASANGLSASEAEDLVAKGLKVLVLANPQPNLTWKDKKPILAQLKYPNDPKTYKQPLSLSKKNITVQNTRREAYVLAVPKPLDDDRIRLILSMTNPYVQNNQQLPLNFLLKTFGSSKIIASRPLEEGDDPTQTKFAALVEDADCTASPCTMFIETQGGSLTKVPVEEVINVVRNQDNEIISQEVVVTASNHALVGGSIYLEQDGIPSNTLEDAVYVCNMLTEQFSGGICVSPDSFCVASERQTPKKLLPCQKEKRGT